MASQTSSSQPITGRARAADDSIVSPGASDDESNVSSTAPASSRRAKRGDESGTSVPRRLGSLQGAGLSSLSLALGADPGYSAGPSLAGFNAISTLLNDPKRPQRAIDPSSSRYPAISQSHTELPKVKRSDYDASLNSIRAEWNRYQHSTQLGIRGKARLAEQKQHGDSEDVSESAQQSNDASTEEQSSFDNEASSRALGGKRLPPLSTVPQIFFSEEFELGNPYTFDLVTERYKAAAAGGLTGSQNGLQASGYDVALNQMLQEKLSYYSDVVEQHLILEISARSSSFFAALGNLQDLEAESRSCLEKVENLKIELDDRDEGIAKAGLHLVREQAKRRGIAERLDAIGLLHQLCEKRDLCQLLVQNSEWSEALGVMSDLAGVIEGRVKLQTRDTDISSALPPHIDLDFASIPAVQELAPQLNEMRESIAVQLEVELINIVAADIALRTGRPQETAAKPSSIEPSIKAMETTEVPLPEADPASAPVAAQKDVSSASNELDPSAKALSQRLEAHIDGLVRTGGVDHLIIGYKDAMFRATRSAMRTYLTEVPLAGASAAWKEDLATLLEDDDAASGRADVKLGQGGIEAASRLRDLPHQEFLGLLRTLLRGLSICIESVEAQRRVFIKLLDERGRQIGGQDEEKDDNRLDLVMPPGVSPSLPTSMNAILSDVCGLAHALASRLLSLRSSSHISLGLKDFLAVFHLAWTFILESERVCGRMIIGLRGVVLNQAKAWLANFHRVRLEKAARAVEEEQWSPTDVSADQQIDVGRIIESATADPTVFIIPRDEIQKENMDVESAHDAANAAADDSRTARTKTLEIEEKQYWVVPASLDVLSMLVDYLRVVINLPLLSTEIMGRVVEFLKQFNSRTCQVVLGAGAMRSAGLKNITARHLALASQSLSVMITLIPNVREAVRRHLNPRQAVMLVEFDKLKRDYQEHQYEIHSKLVAIMGDRLTVHCRALSIIDWNAPIDKEEDKNDDASGNAPVKAVMDLIRETTVLHKRLCTYLQPPVVESIIGQVVLATDERISSELRKVQGYDESAKSRAVAVRDAFNEGYSGLRFVEWKGSAIREVVDEISKREPPPPPAQPASPIPADDGAAKSPPFPPAYKPRLNIFARRQQQQQQQIGSPVMNGRGSIDSVLARGNTSARASTDVARPETSSPSRPSADQAEGDSPSTPQRRTTDLPPESILDSDTPRDARFTDAPPPPTPEKDRNATSSPLARTSTDGSTDATKDVHREHSSPPATPSKKMADLSSEATSELTAAGPVTEAPAGQAIPAIPRAQAQTVTAAATPGRMTLQQRLAEAARKRAQASAESSRSETPLQSQTELPEDAVASGTAHPTASKAPSEGQQPGSEEPNREVAQEQDRPLAITAEQAATPELTGEAKDTIADVPSSDPAPEESSISQFVSGNSDKQESIAANQQAPVSSDAEGLRTTAHQEPAANAQTAGALSDDTPAAEGESKVLLPSQPRVEDNETLTSSLADPQAPIEQTIPPAAGSSGDNDASIYNGGAQADAEDGEKVKVEEEENVTTVDSAGGGSGDIAADDAAAADDGEKKPSKSAAKRARQKAKKKAQQAQSG